MLKTVLITDWVCTIAFMMKMQVSSANQTTLHCHHMVWIKFKLLLGLYYSVLSIRTVYDMLLSTQKFRNKNYVNLVSLCAYSV